MLAEGGGGPQHGMLLGSGEDAQDEGATAQVGEHNCSIVFESWETWLLLMSQSLLWVSLPISLGREWRLLSEFLSVCRMGTKFPSWPLLHFQLQLSPCSLLLLDPQQGGNYLPFPPQTSLTHVSLLPWLTLLLLLRRVCLKNTDVFVKVRFKVNSSLKPFLTSLSSHPHLPGRADNSFL